MLLLLRWITQDVCGSQADTSVLCLINERERPDTHRVAADGADSELPRHVPFEGYWRGDSARSWSFPAFPHRRVRLVYGVARLPAYPHFDLEYPIPIDSWLLDFRKHHLRCLCGPFPSGAESCTVSVAEDARIYNFLSFVLCQPSLH